MIIINKKLLYYSIAGVIFVSLTGSLLHFVYEWSGSSFIVGLFAPVNESTWEHIKLLFFPMLVYSFFMNNKLKESYPCLSSGLNLGNLTGCLLIPVLFYTYTGILGFHTTFADIAVFFISAAAAFYAAYRFTLFKKTCPYQKILWGSVAILFLCMLLFTCFPPHIALFVSP